MGSRTYLSLPRRPLPNRRNIVLTRQDAALFEGAEVVRSVDEILNLNNPNALNTPNTPNSPTSPNSPNSPTVPTTPIIPDNEIFIIGGGQVYEQLLPYTNRLYITRIHHTFPDADTFFPAIDYSQWQLVSRETFPADDKNRYDYSFEEYRRGK